MVINPAIIIFAELSQDLVFFIPKLDLIVR